MAKQENEAQVWELLSLQGYRNTHFPALGKYEHVYTCTLKQHTCSMLTLTQTLKAKTYLPETPLPQHSDELKVVNTKSAGRIYPDPISFFGALPSLSS